MTYFFGLLPTVLVEVGLGCKTPSLINNWAQPRYYIFHAWMYNRNTAGCLPETTPFIILYNRSKFDRPGLILDGDLS